MKIKLKDKKIQLSSSHSHRGVKYADWLKLNDGKSIEIDSIPELIKDEVVEVKTTKPKGQ
ncbi:hypothetical protein HN682_06885 [Candidatus Peregrinibacteria bacterium]|jgi:hypothetical protein|nr:hypothetical protein [Candidatus Peregrinibacteria bacterium]